MSDLLPSSFYLNEDVVFLAKALLGKKLIVEGSKGSCRAVITETEAYAGPWDKASHAYGGKRTKRNEVMYHEGGVAYVYLCYGIHSLFNVVCGPRNTPHAVLIRALKPLDGIDLMKRRRGIEDLNKLCNGPGKLSRAMGVGLRHNDCSLSGPHLRIVEGRHLSEKEIVARKRIGINYAEEHVDLPWRFYIRNSEFISSL